MMKASVAADTATDAKNKRRPFMMNGKRHLERITVQETPIPPLLAHAQPFSVKIYFKQAYLV